MTGALVFGGRQAGRCGRRSDDPGLNLIHTHGQNSGVIEGISAVAFEHDGTLLAGTPDGSVGRWSTRAEGKLIGPPCSTMPVTFSRSRRGADVFLSEHRASCASTRDAGKLLSTIDVATPHAVLSPGGLGVATTRGTIAQLWDASTGKLLHTLKGHSSLVTDAEYSPNGLDLVTVSVDHMGRTWNVRSGHLLRKLVGHSLPVRFGSYSPDGHWIVTASQLAAGLWNARTGQLFLLPRRPQRDSHGGELQPDRRLDPHREPGRDSACLPVRDLPTAEGARGGGQGADPRVALAGDGRRGAARLVPAGEPEQDRVQLLALLRRRAAPGTRPPGRSASARSFASVRLPSAVIRTRCRRRSAGSRRRSIRPRSSSSSSRPTS